MHYGAVHTLLALVSSWLVSLQLQALPTMGALQELQKTQPPPDSLILLYADASECPQCQQAEDIISEMLDQGEITQLIPGLQVLRQKKGGGLARSMRIATFPSLVLTRDGSTAFYLGKIDSADPVFFWLEKAGPQMVTKILTDDTFEHLTQASTGATTGPWAVLFYRSSCPNHFAVLESVGVSEKLWLSVATVNLDQNPKLEQRFKTTSCPEWILEGKMYRYETQKYDLPSMTSFVQSWYRNVKGSVIPREPTPFDALTDSIALYLKTQLQGENRTFTLAVLGGTAVTLVLTSIFCCLTGGSDSKQKTD